MNGTKAVHPGVTTALFSSCNSPGGGGGAGGTRSLRLRLQLFNLEFLHPIPPPCAPRPVIQPRSASSCRALGIMRGGGMLGRRTTLPTHRLNAAESACRAHPAARSCGIPPVHTVFEAGVRPEKHFLAR